MTGGYIRMHRAVTESEAGETDELLGFWVRLLLAANWTSAWFKGRKIEPGQLVLSDRRMQSRLYPRCESPPAINTIKSRLAQMEAAGMIEIDTMRGRQGGRLVTVKNWAKYQHLNASTNASDIDANVDANVDADRRMGRTIKKEEEKGADKSAVSSSRKKAKFDPTSIELPPSLNTAPFRSAWADWVQDRADRKKPMSRKSADLQLRDCAGWGPEKSVQFIEEAIKRGWQGLFDPNQRTQGNKQEAPPKKAKPMRSLAECGIGGGA